MKLTAMTFNIRLHVDSDGENAWPNREDYVVETIKAHDPDVFGVQEALHPMVKKLHQSLPAYEMIGEGRGGGEADEYSAIFYKKAAFTVKDHGQFWLSETPEVANSISWDSACTRICTWAEFSSQDDPTKEFLFLNTHLDHVSQEAREKGIALIINQATSALEKNLPTILTGDFNVTPENKVITDIEQAGLSHLSTEGRTFHDFKGGEKGEPIDYIFAANHQEVEKVLVDRRHFSGRYPSDHYPVIATLTL